jgi:hypothetical protein
VHQIWGGAVSQRKSCGDIAQIVLPFGIEGEKCALAMCRDDTIFSQSGMKYVTLTSHISPHQGANS